MPCQHIVCKSCLFAIDWRNKIVCPVCQAPIADFVFDGKVLQSLLQMKVMCPNLKNAKTYDIVSYAAQEITERNNGDQIQNGKVVFKMQKLFN